KQSVISGVGDGHLDVLVNRLRTRNKLEVELIPVIVPYRETIKGRAENIRGRHKKQSGGSGQFGDVVMSFEASGDLSQEYEFEQRIFGGSVPRQYWPAVEKGVQECCKSGPLAGYPVVGLKAILLDGSYHSVDSNELSFKLAAIIAFKDGFIKAKPVILEPVMKVDIFVPDEYTGDIMGDVNKRRGRILGMTKTGNKQQISAQVPLAEMISYSIELRSITQGRGEFAMEFDSYEEAPNDAAEKIIAYRKQEREAGK
ncbi:MAG: elongation factor G, partial [Defluviitaleaceae bacterium]|nr:elongation factor G [Defluviitaleaceae bacterium]